MDIRGRSEIKCINVELASTNPDSAAQEQGLKSSPSFLAQLQRRDLAWSFKADLKTRLKVESGLELRAG